MLKVNNVSSSEHLRVFSADCMELQLRVSTSDSYIAYRHDFKHKHSLSYMQFFFGTGQLKTTYGLEGCTAHLNGRGMINIQINTFLLKQ